jgi:hypothetical protein
LIMTIQDSTEKQTIRPEELMTELGIKKSKYYEILNNLGIKAFKDSNGKSYLIEEQVEEIKAYWSGNTQMTENDDRDNNSLVKVDNNNLATSANNIYFDSREAIEDNQFDRVLNNAYDLKARELAASDLAVRAIADRITEDDLPQHLKEKLEAVRESVAPKWTPDSLADKILAYHRSKQNNN